MANRADVSWEDHPNRSAEVRQKRTIAEARLANPEFDPLHPTPEENADMTRGLRAGLANIQPREVGVAYLYGWCTGDIARLQRRYRPEPG
jgi:hypothetical protein